MANEGKRINFKKCIAVTAGNYFCKDEKKGWQVRECYKDKPAAKVDKKNFPNIELVNGVLRIDPKEASIETGSSRRTYNGSPLTNASYTPKGFLDFDLEEMIIMKRLYM